MIIDISKFKIRRVGQQVGEDFMWQFKWKGRPAGNQARVDGVVQV